MDTMVILIDADVGQSHVPFTTGLDIFSTFHIVSDIVSNNLKWYNLNCEIPVVLKFRHISLEWRKEIKSLYTFEELQ